ncbi:MAG: DNA-protecting protein DprA [Xanthomonadales bacterium]|nr:DNA-protecting protein DprA [Xanthomonadales bacterium]
MALRAPRLGGAKLIRLHQSLGGIEALTRASGSRLASLGLDEETIHALCRPDQAVLESDINWLQQPGHHLLTWDDERYPALLRDIPSPPAALYADGAVESLWLPQLAVVGSRNPTAGGVANARAFTLELVQQGLTITSGLAAGIDGTAHAAAVKAGGCTVAVTGTGLDRVYPAANRQLAAVIRNHGVLVSEFPPGTSPQRSNFPSRNRIISGLSLGVLVIEAGLNSGSLITARLASEQGREVFALPGSIHNPMSKGCHRLIRDGAKLVESVADILQELAPLAGHLAQNLRAATAPVQPPRLDMGLEDPQIDENFKYGPEYRQLWRALGHDPLPVDSIIRASGLTAKAVSAMLLMLELRGKVEAHPGGAFSRKTRGL